MDYQPVMAVEDSMNNSTAAKNTLSISAILLQIIVSKKRIRDKQESGRRIDQIILV